MVARRHALCSHCGTRRTSSLEKLKMYTGQRMFSSSAVIIPIQAWGTITFVNGFETFLWIVSTRSAESQSDHPHKLLFLVRTTDTTMH
jgi:hypothetical protein